MSTLNWRAGARVCLLLLLLPAVGQGQLFRQRFTGTNALSTYVSGTPTTGQFDFAATSGAGVTITDPVVNSLVMSRTTADAGALVRTTDLAGSPNFIVAQFDLTVTGTTAGAPMATFQVGTGFTANTTLEAGGTVLCAAFAINKTVTAGQFQINATNFVGTQKVVFVVNQSGASQTYSAPTGSTSTVATGAVDVWVGATNVTNDAAVTNVGVSSLTDFKLVFNGANNSSLTIDNLIVETGIAPLAIVPTTGGTYSVGINGDFPSLTRAGGAFAAVNAQASAFTATVVLRIKTDLSEDGANALNDNAGFSVTNRLKIQPDEAFAVTASGSYANTGLGLIQFNGARYVIIDGRQPTGAGIGSSEPTYLTFTNTSAAASNDNAVIVWRGGAQFCQVTYATLRGAHTGTVVGLAVMSSTGSNSDNKLQYCTLNFSGTPGTPINANTYRNGVYSAGQSISIVNERDTVVNCNIVNVHHNSTAQGVNLQSINNAWVIDGNNIYWTSNVSRNGNTDFNGILINNTGAHRVTNNAIGGSAAGATGAFTYTTAVNYVRFRVINLQSVSTSSTTLVSGNTISAISTSVNSGTYQNPLWVGIWVQLANARVTIDGNYIGARSDGTGTVSVTENANGTGGPGGVNGILVSGTAQTTITGNVVRGISFTQSATGGQSVQLNGLSVNSNATGSTVSGNTVRNLTLTSAQTGNAATLVGINVTGGRVAVSGNTVGAADASAANLSLSLSGAATGTLSGILHGGASGDVYSNNVGRLFVSGAGTGSNRINGIWINNTPTAAMLVYNNLVGSTSSANNIELSGSSTTAAVNGIISQSSQAVRISGNTVDQLTNSRTITNATLVGIYALGSGNVRVVSNQVHSLSSASTRTSGAGFANSALVGIGISGSAITDSVASNTVRSLGLTNGGAVNTTLVGIDALPVNANLLLTRNVVYDLSNASTGTSPSAIGISACSTAIGVTHSLVNNMVSLGTGVSTDTRLIGLLIPENGAGSVAVYHNTVHLAGTVTSSTQNTYALLRAAGVNTSVDIRNNLFTSTRSNSMGTGRHLLLGNLNATPTTGWGDNASNFNIFQPGGTDLGEWGTGTYQSFAAWQSNGTGGDPDMDANSSVVTTVSANYLDATAGNLRISDLYTPLSDIYSANGTTALISTVPIDIDGDDRQAPVRCGAHQLTYRFVWTGGGTSDWSTPINWSTTLLPGCGDLAFIPTGNTPYPELSAAATVSRVWIQNAASLTLLAGGVLDFCANVRRAVDLQAGGTFALGPGTVNFRGTFLNNGTLTAGTSTFSLTSAINSQNDTLAGANAYALHAVNVAGTQARVLTRNLAVAGPFGLSGATVMLNGNQLSLSAAITLGGGTLTGNTSTPSVSTSDLLIDGVGAVSGSLSFAAGGQALRNLTLSRVANLNLGSPLTVSGAFAFPASGDAVLGTTAVNLLTLAAGASLSNFTTSVSGPNYRYVAGPLARVLNTTSPSTLDFPIGEGTNTLRALSLSLTQGTATATTYTASMTPSAPPARTLGALTRVSSVRYFTLTQAPAQAVSAASVTLNYAADDGVNNAAELRIAKENGSDWDDLGGTGTGVPEGSITSTVGFTGFSDFVLASAGADNPLAGLLPVQWLSLSAQWQGTAARVDWATASELNNAYFDIERRISSNAFAAIGRVAGSGTTQRPTSYSWLDVDVPSGASIDYRLRQVDFDGRSSYSPIVRLQSTGETSLLLYPNPSRADDLQLVATGPDSDPNAIVTVQLTASNGATLLSLRCLLARVGQQMRAALARSGSGIYYIRLSGGSVQFSQALVIID